MSYDTKCFDLAAAFLADEPHTADDTDALAQAIQDTIEQFLEYDLKRPAPQPVPEILDAHGNPIRF